MSETKDIFFMRGKPRNNIASVIDVTTMGDTQSDGFENMMEKYFEQRKDFIERHHKLIHEYAYLTYRYLQIKNKNRKGNERILRKIHRRQIKIKIELTKIIYYRQAQLVMSNSIYGVTADSLPKVDIQHFNYTRYTDYISPMKSTQILGAAEMEDK